MVVTPAKPLAYARGSYARCVCAATSGDRWPKHPNNHLLPSPVTSRDRKGADGRDTRTTACLRARLVLAVFCAAPSGERSTAFERDSWERSYSSNLTDPPAPL